MHLSFISHTQSINTQ